MHRTLRYKHWWVVLSRKVPMLDRPKKINDKSKFVHVHLAKVKKKLAGYNLFYFKPCLLLVCMLSSDDLMSLLDAGVHVDDPSFVVDPEAIFSEDMFYSSQYGALPRRTNSSGRTSRAAVEREADRDRERTREREALRRERDRWLGNIHTANLDCGSSSNTSKQPLQDKLPAKSCSADPVSVADLLQWWQPDLVRIAALFYMYVAAHE